MKRGRPAPIIFCATGITETVGGIASANRNVLLALQTLGAEQGRPVRTLILNEPRRTSGPDRAFGGARAPYSAAVLAGALSAGLMVFDHVRLAVPLLALPRFLRPPVAICAHGSEAAKRVRPASIRAFRQADVVLANSAFTLSRMQRRFAFPGGVACPLGLPPQFAIQPSPAPPGDERIALTAADGSEKALGDQVLLLVGRMDAGEREKGHRELIEIMPALAAGFPKAQLVLVGDGSDRPFLQEIAGASASAGSIFLTGRVDDGVLERLYRRAYAFVMPSRQEGFGLAYLEAMNWARPCIACHDDGGADVVADEATGLLVAQPIDPDALRTAIERLLQDPDWARRLGQAGWERLRQQFSTQAHQARVCSLLRPLLG
jgi:phosphatidylinositol alpha-1,6-mannosyltransferase